MSDKIDAVKEVGMRRHTEQESDLKDKSEKLNESDGKLAKAKTEVSELKQKADRLVQENQ